MHLAWTLDVLTEHTGPMFTCLQGFEPGFLFFNCIAMLMPGGCNETAARIFVETLADFLWEKWSVLVSMWVWCQCVGVRSNGLVYLGKGAVLLRCVGLMTANMWWCKVFIISRSGVLKLVSAETNLSFKNCTWWFCEWSEQAKPPPSFSHSLQLSVKPNNKLHRSMHLVGLSHAASAVSWRLHWKCHGSVFILRVENPWWQHWVLLTHDLITICNVSGNQHGSSAARQS